MPADLFSLDPVPGDRFLLCSDGLFRELSDDQIAALLSRLADPEEAARELVTEAKFRGGNDNITVIVVDAVDPDADPDPTHALAQNSGEAEVVEAGGAAGGSGPPSDARPGDTRRSRATRPRRRMITLRVVVFSLGVLALLVLAAAGIAWYGRTSYFVGLSGRPHHHLSRAGPAGCSGSVRPSPTPPRSRQPTCCPATCRRCRPASRSRR